MGLSASMSLHQTSPVTLANLNSWKILSIPYIAEYLNGMYCICWLCFTAFGVSIVTH